MKFVDTNLQKQWYEHVTTFIHLSYLTPTYTMKLRQIKVWRCNNYLYVGWRGRDYFCSLFPSHKNLFISIIIFFFVNGFGESCMHTPFLS